MSTEFRRNASRIVSIASTACRSIKADTAEPLIDRSVSACSSSVRTRMPMHSPRHSGCRTTISLSPDIAVATGDAGFDRSDRNSAICGIAAGPIMPNTTGSSRSTASSSSNVFRRASNGSTDASARNWPKARQACTGAHTALESGSPWCNGRRPVESTRQYARARSRTHHSAIWVRKSTDLSSRHRNWIYCHLEAPCGGELEIVRRSGRRWLSGPFKGVRESAPPERASSRTGCRRRPIYASFTRSS
jgi:hypothetical protein